MSEQSGGRKLNASTWNIIDQRKSEAASLETDLKKLVEAYRTASIEKQDILDHVEFSEHDSHFCDAFEVPEQEDGMTLVGSKGQAINRYYLLERWINGLNAGVLQNQIAEEHAEIWAMNNSARRTFVDRWVDEILNDRLIGILSLVKRLNACTTSISTLFAERDTSVIRSKRIIGCTTTAAAKMTQELRDVSPGVLLVEEAGEILESHTLTSLNTNTKQLILIGDHLQLRPKVNNYALTVEKGNGYNLNQSLFERLVRAGVPHSTLQKQHRMCPEISSLVRHLTYPDLLDAPSTLNRPGLKGFQDKLIFLHHDHPEGFPRQAHLPQP